MKVTVIIATSQNRTHWLINRSLLSVYNQVEVDKSKISVLIIDDNEDEFEFLKIQNKIKILRNSLKLSPNEFPTEVLKNRRTRFMSGTGAWNTGIYEAYDRFAEGYISILDDDDEYLTNHLTNCINVLKETTVAVFQRLIWKNEDETTMNVDLTKESLIAKNFYIGNPGVQGSNMFFKTKKLIEINGFDESFPNTTDRDLMIRFLWKNDLNEIVVLENIGVNHYNHKQQKVNNDFRLKQIGLDLFYKKYRASFTKESYQKSIERAKLFFNYKPKEEIVICMPLKNGEKTLEKAIHSVLQQKNVKREVILLVGNDSSTDNSETMLNEIANQNNNIVVLNVNFGKAYLNRNFLNEYARKNHPNCVLIGRLDVDDVIHDEFTISNIENLYDRTGFDVLICGNKQVKNGEVLEWENKPNKQLLNDNFLANQLFEMTQGNPKAELPSCNTFIKPSILIEYPNKISAEDHWFTVQLLLEKEKVNILIDEDLLYCNYSLDGFVTNTNKQNEDYKQSRVELYRYFIEHTKKYTKIKQKWLSYILTDGLSFHIENINKNKIKLEKFWTLDCPVNDRIRVELTKLNKHSVKLLDVCCGPFPKSGIYHESYKIERTLVDAIAEDYHNLLKINNINRNGQSIIQSNVEDILQVLKKKSFDIIYSKNALDHTYNPLIAIENLIKLLSKKGVIILEHFINEGEYTNYFGLHQWNFYLKDNDFYISSKNNEIQYNVNEILKEIKIDSFLIDNKIITTIKNE